MSEEKPKKHNKGWENLEKGRKPFQKGQSGNPSGTMGVAMSYNSKIMRKYDRELVQKTIGKYFTEYEDAIREIAQDKTKTIFERIIATQVLKSLEGDMTSMGFTFGYLVGKPKEIVDDSQKPRMLIHQGDGRILEITYQGGSDGSIIQSNGDSAQTPDDKPIGE